MTSNVGEHLRNHQSFNGTQVETTTTAGSTLRIGQNIKTLIYNPATIPQATLTIALPIPAYDGQEIIIASGGTQTSGTAVTALTLSATDPRGNSITPIGTALTAVAIGTVARYVWSATANNWYRLN